MKQRRIKQRQRRIKKEQNKIKQGQRNIKQRQFWQRGWGVVVFIFVFFSFFIQTKAQSYRSFRSEMKRIIKESLWKMGPFRVDPSLRLRDVGYDGNVYYQREEDEPVSDYTATLSPELRVHVVFRNYLILSFRENPEYVFYVQEKRERRWNNTFAPEFKLLLFHRFVLGGGYSYSSRRWRATSEFDRRANEFKKEFKGSFFYETARETSIGLSAQQAEITYEDSYLRDLRGEEISLARNLNRRETSGNIEIYYRIFSRTFLFMRGGYTDYKFLHNDSRWRDSYSYQGSAGLILPEAGRVRGKISVGYKRLVPRKSNHKDYEGVVGDIEVKYRFWRLLLLVGLRRDSHFSYWTNNLFFIDTASEGGLSFYLSRRVRLDYRFLYGEGRYLEPFLSVQPEGTVEMVRRRDTYRTHTAGIVFRVIGNTGVGLQAILWERDSNYYYENRQRFFVGGYLTYEF